MKNNNQMEGKDDNPSDSEESKEGKNVSEDFQFQFNFNPEDFGNPTNVTNGGFSESNEVDPAIENFSFGFNSDDLGESSSNTNSWNYDFSTCLFPEETKISNKNSETKMTENREINNKIYKKVEITQAGVNVVRENERTLSEIVIPGDIWKKSPLKGKFSRYITCVLCFRPNFLLVETRHSRAHLLLFENCQWLFNVETGENELLIKEFVNPLIPLIKWDEDNFITRFKDISTVMVNIRTRSMRTIFPSFAYGKSDLRKLRKIDEDHLIGLNVSLEKKSTLEVFSMIENKSLKSISHDGIYWFSELIVSKKNPYFVYVSSKEQNIMIFDFERRTFSNLVLHLPDENTIFHDKLRRGTPYRDTYSSNLYISTYLDSRGNEIVLVITEKRKVYIWEVQNFYYDCDDVSTLGSEDRTLYYLKYQQVIEFEMKGKVIHNSQFCQTNYLQKLMVISFGFEDSVLYDVSSPFQRKIGKIVVKKKSEEKGEENESLLEYMTSYVISSDEIDCVKEDEFVMIGNDRRFSIYVLKVRIDQRAHLLDSKDLNERIAFFRGFARNHLDAEEELFLTIKFVDRNVVVPRFLC